MGKKKAKKAKKATKKAQKMKKKAKKALKQPSFMNAGKDCWTPCSKKQGKCAWCGTAGFCCRKGWKGNGCTGAMGINNRHTCVQATAVKAKKKAKKAKKLNNKATKAKMKAQK